MHEVVFLNEKNLIPKKFETEKRESDMWYLDNGASNHMTGNKSYFSELNELITGKVRFGDESCVDIKGRGSIIFQGRNGEHKILKEIYYIPDLKNNILSLGQATESGCEVRMKNDLLTMHDEDGRLLVKVTRSSNRLYKIRMGIAKPTCLRVSIDTPARDSTPNDGVDRHQRAMSIDTHHGTADASWRWHARLGHIGFAKLKTMAEKEIVTGMPKIVEENKICTSCIVGKQTRKSFPSSTMFRAAKPLELVHGDLCGSITPSTLAQNRYIFVLIDDFSRYMWTILLKEKSDAFEKFKRFKALRTDRGGEFMLKEFQVFCENTGIIRHLTAPYTPQQNGVVERRNRTVMEMTRSMMKSMRVPNYLWGEAVRHSTYLINRITTRALENLTPYESFKNKKPNIQHLRVFGCLCYAKVDSSHLRKLDDRSRKLVHLGTEPGSKAYRLYDPTTRRVVVSRDVVFDEGRCWRWGEPEKTEVNRPGMFQFEWGGVMDNGHNGDDNEEEDETVEMDEPEIDETGESGTFVDSSSTSNSSSNSNSANSNTSPSSDQRSAGLRRTIGCLRYLLHSRPDLSYAVGVLSRYMQSPRESHGQAMKHILRYVKGTTRYGLMFKRACTKELVGYSDSSHNIDPDDGRSTTGHVFYLGSSPITWCSQKQPTVALSSCEAEFMAATEAAKQAIWLKDLLDEVQGTEGGKVLMRIDNKSAIALTKNPVFHGRSKHILSKYHFIRECVENEQIFVEHIPGVEQKADILTKPLGRIKFKEMRSLIGVGEIQDPKIHAGIKGENVG